jgi:hypothetical protein
MLPRGTIIGCSVVQIHIHTSLPELPAVVCSGVKKSVVVLFLCLSFSPHKLLSITGTFDTC